MLFEDETDLLLFPPLQAAWALRGQSQPVLLSGYNARRVVFGAIHLDSGHRLLWPQEHQRAENFQEFLDRVHWHYRRWYPVLLVDEDPSHTAAESQSVAEDLEIELLWLPKRAPELNGMDQLWRRCKPIVSANQQYESIDEHVDRFIDYVLRLSSEEALTKAGMLSRDFWLRNYRGGPHSLYG